MANQLINSESKQNWLSYDFVRVVLASVLLLAASLKAYQLSTEPVLNQNSFDSRWVLIGIVELELALGLWLLFGLLPRWTWRAAIACFATFACISLFKAISGEASCGCFGNIPVSPWLTSLFDLAAISSLIVWRPTTETQDIQPNTPRHRLITALFSLILIGVPSALAMASYRPATISGEGIITGSGNIVVLQPEEWLGKKFPLFDHIDIGSQLKQGQWHLVLYRHDCQKCQEKMPFYRELAKDHMKKQNGYRLVMLELPPYGKRPQAQQAPIIWARLNEERKWFVEIPQILILSEGNVKSLRKN